MNWLAAVNCRRTHAGLKSLARGNRRGLRPLIPLRRHFSAASSQPTVSISRRRGQRLVADDIPIMAGGTAPAPGDAPRWGQQQRRRCRRLRRIAIHIHQPAARRARQEAQVARSQSAAEPARQLMLRQPEMRPSCHRWRLLPRQERHHAPAAPRIRPRRHQQRRFLVLRRIAIIPIIFSVPIHQSRSFTTNLHTAPRHSQRLKPRTRLLKCPRGSEEPPHVANGLKSGNTTWLAWTSVHCPCAGNLLPRRLWPPAPPCGGGVGVGGIPFFGLLPCPNTSSNSPRNTSSALVNCFTARFSRFTQASVGTNGVSSPYASGNHCAPERPTR